MTNFLPTPEFEVGRRVTVILNDHNRTPHVGQIGVCVWHSKHGRYFYLLIEDGKWIKKRYWAEDLIPTGA